MDSFTVVVNCGTQDNPHRHEVTISHADSQVVGAARPANVRLQYTCPVTGATRIMTFKPPGRTARPFAVLAVT